MNVDILIKKQRLFYKSGKTVDLNYRIGQLQKLALVLKANERQLYDAINHDFKKSEFDTYSTELSFIYHEIKFFIKKIKVFSKPEKVFTNLVNFPGKSRIFKEPFGNVLVIGAWNYPYQLSLLPAICAIAAGNTCILKPSEIAVHTSALMAKLINENFESDFFHVLEGGTSETTALLKHRFDKIFFTGSPNVGKIVYEAAAKHLTPVTLELGGKSPVIVTNSADVKVAAKRIVWGKFLNAGQTCIAPDFLLVQKEVKSKLISEIKNFLNAFDYLENAQHYTNIINATNFERLLSLIDESKVIYGNKKNKDTNYLSPTLLDHVTWEDQVMREEIFGPILPILTFDNLASEIDILKEKEKPLSAYLFSNDNKEQELFLKQFSFGGGCINDVVMHIANSNLPFGGVGNSGIGSYHGKYGFETFSHRKSVLKRTTWGEPNLKYPPYTKNKLSLLRKLM